MYKIFRLETIVPVRHKLEEELLLFAWNLYVYPISINSLLYTYRNEMNEHWEQVKCNLSMVSHKQ